MWGFLIPPGFALLVGIAIAVQRPLDRLITRIQKRKETHRDRR